jgi:hypothetical protein
MTCHHILGQIMDYFPLSLAIGGAFCNRKQEVKTLCFNLLESRPTLIVSPRRYGKTSLAIHAITQAEYHHAQFDFLSAVNESDIEKIILKGVGSLIGRLEKGPKKALKLATDLFSGLSFKLSFDRLGLGIEIDKKSARPADGILGILERVEKLSEKYQEKIVLFFDEFQRIYELSEGQAIESVIRQIAQASKRLSFIFSGSNRHLLYQMFNDRNGPFYKLCDRITLDRIEEKDYTGYLQQAAEHTWGRKLEKPVCDAIFGHTERHPYYINLLCSRLWRLPSVSVNEVDRIWSEYIIEEHSQVAIELDLLSSSQRKLLVNLARCGGTQAPRGSEFQVLSSMPGATITQALGFLERKNYIYRDHQGYYRVLDPMLKAVLSG